jgi:hypothetical protein
MDTGFVYFKQCETLHWLYGRDARSGRLRAGVRVQRASIAPSTPGTALATAFGFFASDLGYRPTVSIILPAYA